MTSSNRIRLPWSDVRHIQFIDITITLSLNWMLVMDHWELGGLRIMVNHLHSNVVLKFFSRGTIKISRPKNKQKRKESIEDFLFLQFKRVEGFFSVVTSFNPLSHLFSGSK